MTSKFIAKIYLDKDVIDKKEGEDLDELYAWMLAKAEGHFGNVHGECIDKISHEVVRKFRKAPPD